MARPLTLIEQPVDRLLVSVNETLRSFTHEAWQYASQVANGSSVFVLGFLHKPSLDNYIKQQKRIHHIEPKSPLPGISPFANVVNRNKAPNTNEEKLEKSSPSASPSASPLLQDVRMPKKKKDKRRKLNYSQPSIRNSWKPITKSVSEPDLLSLANEWDEIQSNVPDDINVDGVSPTGLFEDLRLFQLTVINFIMTQIRWLWHSLIAIGNGFSIVSLFSLRVLLVPFYILQIFWINLVDCFRFLKNSFTWILQAIFNPSEYLSKQGIDNRTKEEIVKDSGYPYELHPVTTEDGYVITLERLPNPDSRKVLYFQHGLIDSGFTWLASGNSTSLAMAAFDAGYDVFLGNFRGNPPTSHVDPNISSASYWDFTINDHAWKDIPAFVQYIQQVKREELDVPDSESEDLSKHFQLTTIAHSMGGMAALMYIIKRRLDKTDHGFSHVVLLSPAGIHKDSPPLAKIGAPLIDFCLRLMPFVHSLRFPSNLMRVVSAKVMEDVKSTNPTRDLFTYIATTLIGGNVENHSLNRVNMVRWVFTGTPVGVFRHFRQLISSKKFQAYDFGKKRNLEVYGTPEPLNFLDHYDLIDVPVYYMMGLIDNLIRPANVIAHFDAHAKHQPDKAFLKAFADAGHVEFTLGVNEEMANVILSCLETNEVEEPAVTFHSLRNTSSENVQPE